MLLNRYALYPLDIYRNSKLDITHYIPKRFYIEEEKTFMASILEKDYQRLLNNKRVRYEGECVIDIKVVHIQESFLTYIDKISHDNMMFMHYVEILKIEGKIPPNDLISLQKLYTFLISCSVFQS